ncbi:homoserine O-acetyltransferase/O-succinyltransferase family protein [Lichenicoccus sp.]|uniref:homoserine O-acetyltransferase/O-succinyltransferase family protein n=1 Tax=Lichenicoccus sp. TaxID=2781899 RepID=UPI003D0AD8B8
MNVVAPIALQSRLAPGVTIGLVNNASGSALLATERQFARGMRMPLRLFTCPEIARDRPPHGADGAPYERFDDLFACGLDALIVTGLQPRAARLQDEPAWSSLARIADWAARHDVPVLWSCLAAHAAVLRLDGIARTRLPRKLSGVFPCAVAAPGHPLMRGLARGWAHPHSRYNDLAEAALVARGYRILSRSPRAGVDVFAGPLAGPGRFVFFQGHPEYEAETLLAEYRRDLLRTLRGGGGPPPAPPSGVLPAATEAALGRLAADDSEAALRLLDNAAVTAPWQPRAARLFGNWLAGFAPNLAPGLAPDLWASLAVAGM